MRTRNSARLLIINSLDQVLLFKFSHRHDALAGKTYWATPGGEVEPRETFEQGAIRELKEETGIYVDNVGASLAEHTFEMTLPSGEVVVARERFFLVKIDNEDISTEGFTDNEKLVISHYRWWSFDELRKTRDIVYPTTITDIIAQHNSPRIQVTGASYSQAENKLIADQLTPKKTPRGE